MPLELRSHIGAFRLNLEAILACVANQCLDQLQRHSAPTDFGRDQCMLGHPHSAARNPGQPPDRFCACNTGVVFARLIIAMTGNADWLHGGLLA